MQSVYCAFRAFFRFSIVAFLLGGLVVSGLISTRTASAAPGINQQINFQGRLLNAQGAAVADGFYNIQFKIYQDGTGTVANNPSGTLEWTENWTNQGGNGVQVKNGYMSVQLGSVNPFGSQVDWNQDTLWLSINIGNTNASCTPITSCALDGEMLPMKRLGSTPYAMNAGMLGGMTSAQFVQMAQGVQTDATNNTSSIYLNKTGTGGNFLQLQSGGTNAFTINSGGDLSFGSNQNHSISIDASTAGTTGRSLSISAGSANAGGAAAAGGTLNLQGGSAAGTGNNNGGDVNIAGGAGIGTGYGGIVNIGASSYTTGTNTPCAVNCTISQSIVDTNGAVIVSATDPAVNITLPAPRKTTAGRILYVTTTNTSTDFTLIANTGGDLLNVTMKANTTATMIWNGVAWTPGGASNAITLQATYNNGTNPSATPEIKLDTIRSTIDIQDADTTIGADIFNIRGSNGGSGSLGQVLFGVGNDGRVTIQGTTNQSSAFRVMNASGEYMYNINSSNGYVISNSISAADNEITNPGFEAGGSISNGEEGWFGPAQASFVNNSANANTGNYSMNVSPTGSNMDMFAGSYREVTSGENYFLSGYIKQSGANGNGGIQVTWYDKDKAVLSYSTNYAGAVGASYGMLTVSAAAPANAVYARVSATVRSTANAGTYYFDDFTFKRNSQSAPYTYRNASDSAAAFRIQSAGSGQTLFTANTSNNIIKIGDSTGSDTNMTMLVLDSASVDPTTVAGRDGGMFYNSATNSFKAIIGGSVVDICTTAVTCTGYSASAGSVIQLQASSPGTTQTGNFNISGTGIAGTFKSHDSTTGAGENLTVKSGTTSFAGAKGGNLVLDSGTGPGGSGDITIGHSGVDTIMAGGLAIQGSGLGGATILSLGNAGTVAGSVKFNSSAGSNDVTLNGPSTSGTAYSLTMPGSLGAAGSCVKTDASGNLYFQNCGVGANVNLQDVYNNSSTPAEILMTNGKDFKITAPDTATDANVLFNLQCVTSCGTNGRFSVQSAGANALTVNPTGKVVIGSETTDSTINLFQLDSYNGATEPGGTACGTTVNQGAIYYNTNMSSIRGCIDNAWVDISNPDTLGLLTFGIVPSSGATSGDRYDLPSLTTPGVSGPCRVSWASTTSVNIGSCTAYSNGKRVNIAATTLTTNSGTAPNTNLTTASRWGHICVNTSTGQPSFTTTAGFADPKTNLPTFDAVKPVLCLADIQGSATTAGVIDNIYDVRTFTSTMKEAVNTSTAVELGMLTDAAGTNGAMVPSTSASQKLYGAVVATDGSTSAGVPNTIVSTVGPAWVKANAGTAGQFVISSTTAGYSTTNVSIPNNSFYYSAGNTRTGYSTTCTATNNCSGSLYVNFIVR